jgi:hypothetical protein
MMRMQESKQNTITGEIIILSSCEPVYWFGEKSDYQVSEIENNPEWVTVF